MTDSPVKGGGVTEDAPETPDVDQTVRPHPGEGHYYFDDTLCALAAYGTHID